MSPAKRKTARPARRTAGSGSKSRRSSTPLAASKRKTPAKGKSHRAGRGTAGVGVSCDMPRERLEGLLDREGDRADVLAHVPACGPCTTALTVVAAQRDSMRHLSAEPTGTAVEFLLERGKQAGERRLADLVYELAKACLVVVKDIDRRVHLETRPRVQEAIGRDVRGVSRRLNGPARRDVAGRLPLEKPDESSALRAAESCITILEQVEGATERQRLSWAVYLICIGEPAKAEEVLTSLASHSAGTAIEMHALRNLLWAMIRQEKYGDLLALERSVLRRVSGDWECTFNLAVAAANSGNGEVFARMSSLLRRIDAPNSATRKFRQSVIAFESSRLAGPLGWTHARVSRALGSESASTIAGTS